MKPEEYAEGLRVITHTDDWFDGISGTITRWETENVSVWVMLEKPLVRDGMNPVPFNLSELSILQPHESQSPST